MLHGIEARKWVFQGRPTQKMGFFAQKWPKNAYIRPNTLSFGLGRTIQGPPTLCCRCLTQKNIGCMLWKPGNRGFWAATPKRWPFFGQKRPKIANFGQKSIIFGPGCSGQGPPTRFFRCLTRKNMCCMVLTPENQCFRVAPPKKWAFFAQKRPKNGKNGPKHCFLGLGGQFKAPQPYFAGA